MHGNLKGAFKLFAIVATAAGLVALAPAEVQARGGDAAGGNGAGGMSATQMSATGAMNTNGPNASDRDRGKNRAGDRMSASGAAHGKGATHVQGSGAAGGMAVHKTTGGKSATHMSATGKLNTNGPNATDRDFGRNRAADRMSASGATHSKGVTRVHATHVHSTLKRKHIARHHTIAT